MENRDEKSHFDCLDEPIYTPEDYRQVIMGFILAAIVGIGALFVGAWLGFEAGSAVGFISFLLFVMAFDSWKEWFADQIRRQERERQKRQIGNAL